MLSDKPSQFCYTWVSCSLIEFEQAWKLMGLFQYKIREDKLYFTLIPEQEFPL